MTFVSECCQSEAILSPIGWFCSTCGDVCECCKKKPVPRKKKVGLPESPPPPEIWQWVRVNGLECLPLCVCKCGAWYAEMDHLAPYHLERCVCAKCGAKKEPMAGFTEFRIKHGRELPT